MISIKQAYETFQYYFPSADYIALREAWNSYTDSLAKDGDMCELQYHYCPAYGDDMPEDDIEFILDRMGFDMDAECHSKREDVVADEWPQGCSHWLCTLSRDGAMASFWYSMGPALKGEPELKDVLSCLSRESHDVLHCDTFEEWADCLGYDTDSRKAEKVYHACRDNAAKLSQLLGKSDLEQLADLFQDY